MNPIGAAINYGLDAVGYETEGLRKQRLGNQHTEAQIATQLAVNRKAEAEAARLEAQGGVTDRLLETLDQKNKVRTQQGLKALEIKQMQEKHNRWAGSAMEYWKNKDPKAAAAEMNRSFQDPNFKEYLDRLTNDAGIQAFEPLNLNDKSQKEALTRMVLNKAGLKMGEVDPKKLESMVQELANSRFFIGKTPNGYHMLPVSAVAALTRYGDSVSAKALEEIKSWDAQALELENDEKTLRSMLELFIPKEKSKDGNTPETEEQKITARTNQNRKLLDDAFTNGSITVDQYRQGLLYTTNKDFPKGIPFLAGQVAKDTAKGTAQGKQDGTDLSFIQDIAHAENQGKAMGTAMGAAHGWDYKVKFVEANESQLQAAKEAFLNIPKFAQQYSKHDDWKDVAGKPIPRPEQLEQSLATILGVAQHAGEISFSDLDFSSKDVRARVTKGVQAAQEAIKGDIKLQSRLPFAVKALRLSNSLASKEFNNIVERGVALRSIFNGASETNFLEIIKNSTGLIDSAKVKVGQIHELFGFKDEVQFRDKLSVGLSKLHEAGAKVPPVLKSIKDQDIFSLHHTQALLDFLHTEVNTNLRALSGQLSGDAVTLADSSGRYALINNIALLDFIEDAQVAAGGQTKLTVQPSTPPKAQEDGVLTRGINWGKRLFPWNS